MPKLHHKETHNSQELKSFTAYCRAHPDQRFWQALRNWANVAFVGVSHDKKYWEDTFYLEAGEGADLLLNE